MVHSFRMSRRNYRAFIFGIVLFSSVSLVSGIGMYLDNEPHLTGGPRLLFGLFFGVMWLPFVLLSVWLLRGYYRGRLLIGARSVALRGLIRTQRIGFKEIVKATWGVSGSLRLETSHDRLTIGMSEFVTHQQDKIVSLLRERLNRTIEVGWEKIERYLEFQRKRTDPQHRKQFLLRLRWLVLVPIIATITWVGLRLVYGQFSIPGVDSILPSSALEAGLSTALSCSVLDCRTGG